MTTTEKNVLIARFMGGKMVEVTPLFDKHFMALDTSGMDCYVSLPKRLDTFGGLKYHKSWDWLMPVIEKIETLGYTFEKNYQRVDKDWQCLIVKGHDILHQEFDRKSLSAAHYVAVEFIEWYNESLVVSN